MRPDGDETHLKEFRHVATVRPCVFPQALANYPRIFASWVGSGGGLYAYWSFYDRSLKASRGRTENSASFDAASHCCSEEETTASMPAKSAIVCAAIFCPSPTWLRRPFASGGARFVGNAWRSLSESPPTGFSSSRLQNGYVPIYNPPSLSFH